MKLTHQEDGSLINILQTYLYHGEWKSDRWVRQRPIYSDLRGLLEEVKGTPQGGQEGKP